MAVLENSRRKRRKNLAKPSTTATPTAAIPTSTTLKTSSVTPPKTSPPATSNSPASSVIENPRKKKRRRKRLILPTTATLSATPPNTSTPTPPRAAKAELPKATKVTSPKTAEATSRKTAKASSPKTAKATSPKTAKATSPKTSTPVTPASLVIEKPRNKSRRNRGKPITTPPITSTATPPKISTPATANSPALENPHKKRRRNRAKQSTAATPTTAPLKPSTPTPPESFTATPPKTLPPAPAKTSTPAPPETTSITPSKIPTATSPKPPTPNTPNPPAPSVLHSSRKKRSRNIEKSATTEQPLKTPPRKLFKPSFPATGKPRTPSLLHFSHKKHRRNHRTASPATTPTHTSPKPSVPATAKTLIPSKPSSFHSSTPASSSPLSRLPTTSLHIQECSFMQWDVSGISAVATSPDSLSIAAARTNGQLELRRSHVDWAVVSELYSHSSLDMSVSSLCYSPCGRYLFVARLDGSVTIVRVMAEGLVEHVRIVPGGGAVWDLAVGGKGHDAFVLALACDDGCVRFVSIDEAFIGEAMEAGGEELSVWPKGSEHYIVRSSESTKARVLSVAFAPEEAGQPCVVCGDAEGGVRWIDPTSGRVYGRGKISSLRMEFAMIWTVAFTREGRNVVCGDSRGMVTVWSSATNTMIQEVRMENVKGGIWSSAVVKEQDGGVETVFFGCAFGSVAGLRAPKEGEDDESWIPLRATRFHSHDIRGMASCGNGKIVTTSLDARICVFSTSDFIERKTVRWVLPYPGCVGQPPVQFCKEKRLILSRRRWGVDIWSIPELGHRPLLKLRMKLKNFESELISCAISENGCLLSVSSIDSFRQYEIWDGEGNLSSSKTFGKVHLLEMDSRVESMLHGVVDMEFCGNKLVCISQSKTRLLIFEKGTVRDCDMNQIGSSGKFLDRVRCSGDNVAVCDSVGDVFLATLETDTLAESDDILWRKVMTHGKSLQKVTALAFSQSRTKLAIATSEKIVFTKHISQVKEDNDERAGPFSEIVTSVSFSPNEKSLLVSGEKFCCISSGRHRAVPKPSKKRKREQGEDGIDGIEIQDPFKLNFKNSVLGSCALGPSRLVVARRAWNLVKSSLPDAIPKKPYGT